MSVRSFIAPLIAIAAVVGVFLYAFELGQDIERGKQAQSNAELLLSAYNEYEARIERQRESAKLAVEGRDNELEKIRAEYDRLNRAGGLRLPAAICDQLSTSAGTSGIDEAAAGTVALPEGTESRLRSIARQADEVTAQCRALITWVNDLEQQHEQ